jgi:hypothetical protein
MAEATAFGVILAPLAAASPSAEAARVLVDYESDPNIDHVFQAFDPAFTTTQIGEEFYRESRNFIVIGSTTTFVEFRLSVNAARNSQGQLTTFQATFVNIEFAAAPSGLVQDFDVGPFGGGQFSAANLVTLQSSGLSSEFFERDAYAVAQFDQFSDVGSYVGNNFLWVRLAVGSDGSVAVESSGYDDSGPDAFLVGNAIPEPLSAGLAGGALGMLMLRRQGRQA